MGSDKTPKIILTKQDAIDILYAPRSISKKDPIGHMIYFYEAMSAECLPKAETLTYVTASLKKYVESGGEITLDEAFDLKSKPKAGNPARLYERQKSHNGKFSAFAKLVAAGKTQREAATILLEKTNFSDATTEEVDQLEAHIAAFIKGYNRWPLRKHIIEILAWCDGIHDAIDK